MSYSGPRVPRNPSIVDRAPEVQVVLDADLYENQGHLTPFFIFGMALSHNPFFSSDLSGIQRNILADRYGRPLKFAAIMEYLALPTEVIRPQDDRPIMPPLPRSVPAYVYASGRNLYRELFEKHIVDNIMVQ